MDKLTAQKILGVSPGASKREIKRAYAAMLRMYHPEDYPEEFQKIQEAYETLNKGSAPENGFSEEAYSREDFHGTQEEKEPEKFQEPFRNQEKYRETEQQEEQYRRKIQEEEYQKAREQLDFEKAEWKAQEEKKLKEKEVIAAALKDLAIIVNTPSKRHRLKAYEDFFVIEEYKEILFLPECVEGVCKILENTWLKREVYDLFAREYHMREYKPEQLKPGARKLYHILDSHCKFGKKRHKYQIGGGIFVAVILLLRSLMRATDHKDWFYFILVLVTAGFYWGYYWLLKSFSRWRIHVFYSLIIMVSQFIMLMTEAYTPLLGNREAGDIFGALVFLGGFLYFLVTAVAYIFAGIFHKTRKKQVE